MTKKFKGIAMGAAVAVACAGSYVAGNFGRPSSSRTSDLLLQNVEVLSRAEDDVKEEPDKIKGPKEACLSEGGNWNEASHCTGTGFENSTCTISGEISLFGVTIKGSYSKGKSYKIPWARYSCAQSAGNCCKKQGLYSGNEKLA